MPTPTPSPELETLGDPLAAGTNLAASAAELDSAFAAFAKEKGVAEDQLPPELVKAAKPEDKSDEKPAATPPPAMADDKKAGGADSGAANRGEPKPEAKAEVKPTADKTEDKPATEDRYKDIQLPATARGASAQAFATLKARAAQDLTAANAETAKLRSELEQIQEQVKKLVPADKLTELEKELADHRNWRAKIDVEADPAIHAKFDERVQTARQFIYAKLKATGKITDDTIKKIEDFGGPEEVNMDEILAKLGDATLTRLVTGKLDEIDAAKFEKQRALDAAKANLDGYLAERRKNFEQAATAHNEATKTVLTDLLSKVPFMAPKQLKPDASDADKKAVADHEAFLKDVNETLAQSIQDDSPEMRAVLLAGIAQHLWLKKEHAATVAKLAEAEKASGAKIKELETKLEEATAKLGRFTKASVTHLHESNAPAKGGGPAPKVDPFNTSAAQAMEAYRQARAQQAE